MAYNRRNLLQRIVDIQEITLESKKHGATQAWVWREKIFPVYRISLNTYYSYLGINAKRELKQMDEAAKAEQDQLKLF